MTSNPCWGGCWAKTTNYNSKKIYKENVVRSLLAQKKEKNNKGWGEAFKESLLPSLYKVLGPEWVKETPVKHLVKKYSKQELRSILGDKHIS